MLQFWVRFVHRVMWRGGNSNDADSSEQPRQGCATFSSSSISCTNGDCKEISENYRKCPGLPLQRFQRNSDGTGSWVNQSHDLPFGLGGDVNLNEFMRSFMCGICERAVVITFI